MSLLWFKNHNKSKILQGKVGVPWRQGTLSICLQGLCRAACGWSGGEGQGDPEASGLGLRE